MLTFPEIIWRHCSFYNHRKSYGAIFHDFFCNYLWICTKKISGFLIAQYVFRGIGDYKKNVRIVVRQAVIYQQKPDILKLCASTCAQQAMSIYSNMFRFTYCRGVLYDKIWNVEICTYTGTVRFFNSPLQLGGTQIYDYLRLFTYLRRGTHILVLSIYVSYSYLLLQNIYCTYHTLIYLRYFRRQLPYVVVRALHIYTSYRGSYRVPYQFYQ